MVSGVGTEVTRDARPGLHPGKGAVLLHKGREIASFGKVDPRLAHAFGVRLPVYLCSIFLDNVPDYTTPVYHPPSRYPSTYRDLALVVDLDVSAERACQVTKDAIGAIARDVHAFDEYRGSQIGEGKKSLAIRAVIQKDDGTITDEETDEAIARALGALRETLGAGIRE